MKAAKALLVEDHPLPSLEVAVRKQVPTVSQAIKALHAMERELTTAKTYATITKIIKKASALNILLGHVTEVKTAAEDTILVASARIGEEIRKTPKATNAPSSADWGRGKLGIPETSRRRFTSLADAGTAAVKRAARTLRGQGKDATPSAVATYLKYGDKADRRAEREIVLAKKQIALPTKRYGVIYADPPWAFKVRSEKGLDRAADNHYPTLSLAEIINLPIEKIAAADCVLFLWATGPMLDGAFDVLKAWGFSYRSRCVWVKDKIGTGYWFRDQAEELLVGVRGTIPAPTPGTQYSSAIHAPVGKHSVKPFCFREMIEDMFSNLPRIELFAREKFEGWDCWGNEVEGSSGRV